MNLTKVCVAVGALFLTMSAAHATTAAVVNLCADEVTVSGTAGCSSAVNAGVATANTTAGSAGTYNGKPYAVTYNPVAVNLAAGAYTVNVIGTGISGGNGVTSIFNAYTITAPTGSNNVYSDGGWAVQLGGTAAGGGTTTSIPGVGASAPTFSTAAAALAYGSANFKYNFFLNTAQTVYFSLDDIAQPYFTDDTGGVSLAVNTAVPEPMTASLFGLGVVALGVSRRRRAKQA